MNTEHVISIASSLTGWRKSSHSGGSSGGCLEVSDRHAGSVPVRDSKNATGPALLFRSPAWSVFVAAVRHGELTT